MKDKKVRYITVSRLPLELVATMPDAEIATFMKTLLLCFKQLENGESVDYPKPENAILALALEESMSELINGYERYMQKVNAHKSAKHQDITDQSVTNHRPITDQSATNQRPTIDIYNEENKKNNVYQNDINAEIFEKMEQAGFDVDVSMVAKTNILINKFGKDSVIEAIDRCYNHSACDFNYMRKVLENMAKAPYKQDDDDLLDKYGGWA